MIDVHILVLPETNRKWLSECLKSLEDEPINLFICDGIRGDTAKARTKAFDKGISKYVSFVDPDDIVIKGTFAKLVNLLETDCVMAYSDEMLIDSLGNEMFPGWSCNSEYFMRNGYDIRVHCIKEKYVHHLRVMKRKAVMKCLPLKTKIMPEPCLMHNLSKLGNFAHLREIGYKWRIHRNNTFYLYNEKEHAEVLNQR